MLRVGTADVHVEASGAGDPVLLLHSSGMSSRQWRHLAGVLATTHRVLVPDLLGYGKTTSWAPGSTFDFHEDVAVATAILESLDQPAHVVGHSYGGLLALTATRLSPALVRSVAVYDPVAYGVVHDAADDAALGDLATFDDAFFDDAGGGSAAWFERFIDYWNGNGAWRAMPEAQRSAFLSVGRKVFLEVRSLCLDRTPRSAYSGLQTPTLVLSGGQSPPAARRVCEILGGTLPAARLVVMEALGHMGPLVAPGEVNANIAEHVRTH